MNKNDYNREVIKWNRWAARWTEWANRKQQLIKTLGGHTLEECEEINRRLEKEFGCSETKIWEGPWTKIYDLRDLENPNFILPGLAHSFIQKPNSGEILKAFGKTVVSDMGDNQTGVVIGYAYDAMDDYLILKTEEGKESYLLINTEYHILGEEKEEDN